jgi:tetratricopeptide (TPR) repeat protein
MDMTSGIISAELANSLFITSSEKQAQLESLANNALSTGIDLYQQQDYEGAAKAFQSAFNLAPTSTYAVDSTKYLAQSYLKLGKTDKAIEAYKTAISFHRDQDDLNTALGNLYFAEDRFSEATAQYQEAVRINPSANNRFSLGQGYIKMEEFGKAEAEYNKYIQMEPESAYGYYGLGQAYSAQGKYEDAVERFEAALGRDSDFYDVHLEMGYAYADMGEIDKAKEIQEFLEDKDDNLGSMLKLHIYDVEPPKISFAWPDSSFEYTNSMNTPLSAMDPYFEQAGASKVMTMKFMFTKEMDVESIENRFNWTISRATDSNLAETYNFGDPVSATEISLSYYPDYVYYDKTTMSATLCFTVEQNDTADGTIDPEHIVFKFKGEDAYGISIDSEYDEFSGFSGVA